MTPQLLYRKISRHQISAPKFCSHAYNQIPKILKAKKPQNYITLLQASDKRPEALKKCVFKPCLCKMAKLYRKPFLSGYNDYF